MMTFLVKKKLDELVKKLFLFLLITFFLFGCKKKIPHLNEELIIPKPIFEEKITPEIQKIIDLSYNWKFDTSLIEVQKIREKYHDKMLLDLLTVGTLFWQYISAVTVDENNKARDAFSKIIEEIKVRTEEILVKEPDNLKALYLLGFTEGSQSKFYAIEGDFFKAYRFGVKGYNRLKKIEKINNNDFDTQFGIGLYKYYCATLLPRWFQRLSWMVPGIDVDREGGFHRIYLSSKYSILMKTEAELALSQGYSSYEREYKKGFELIEKLSKSYPDNKVFAYTQNIASYYVGMEDRYSGKPEKAIKTFKKALKLANDKPSFRMYLRKKSFLLPDMKWRLDVPSEHEIIFSLYRELGRTYFYLKEFELADQILLEGAQREALGKNIRAALYFEIGRQHKIIDKSDYKDFIIKSSETAGEGSEIAAHCKTFLGTHFVFPKPEIEIWKLQCKIMEGKVGIKEVLELKYKYNQAEYSNYDCSFFEIMYQFYDLNNERILAEKYHDEVRFFSQLDK